MPKDYEETRVAFRIDRGEVVAVFPDHKEHNGDLACYSRQGQHSICSRDWYKSTREASAEEYRSLLMELKSVGYSGIRVVRRFKW